MAVRYFQYQRLRYPKEVWKLKMDNKKTRTICPTCYGVIAYQDWFACPNCKLATHHSCAKEADGHYVRSWNGEMVLQLTRLCGWCADNSNEGD